MVATNGDVMSTLWSDYMTVYVYYMYIILLGLCWCQQVGCSMLWPFFGKYQPVRATRQWLHHWEILQYVWGLFPPIVRIKTINDRRGINVDEEKWNRWDDPCPMSKHHPIPRSSLSDAASIKPFFKRKTNPKPMISSEPLQFKILRFYIRIIFDHVCIKELRRG